MSAYGLTKARTAGGVADVVERAGGSIERVFRRADLPLRLIDRPEHLILLRDQTRLLDAAAREIGDDALPARLSTDAGCFALGAYADAVCAQPTLGEAIACANGLLDRMLQSSTRQRLTVRGDEAIWTYELTDRAVESRQTNELLCLGYRLDMMRRYLGGSWSPIAVTLPGRMPDNRCFSERTLRCHLSPAEMMSVIFRADALETPGTAPPRGATGPDVAEQIPDDGALVEFAEALIALDLLERMPGLDDLSRRLGVPRRSLQRRLANAGSSFASLRDGVLMRKSQALLGASRLPLTEIALALGYADLAHFSRAFRRWTGRSPSGWPATPDRGRFRSASRFGPSARASGPRRFC
jgi:AraC-like DNA-binding protein